MDKSGNLKRQHSPVSSKRSRVSGRSGVSGRSNRSGKSKKSDRSVSRKTKKRKTSKSVLTRALGKRSISISGNRRPSPTPSDFDPTASRKRYTKLGFEMSKVVNIPFECLKKLNELGIKSEQICMELGGTVCLRTFKIIEDVGEKGTNSNTYIPSEASLKRRNVLRFHCHPQSIFPTPPSFQDLIQLCKDYVQRHDGIYQHIVVTPTAFYMMCIPDKILYELDQFNAQRAHMSGVKRKAEFLDSTLFEAIVLFCERIENYQKCNKGKYNNNCIKTFITHMKKRFGFDIEYKPFKHCHNMYINVNIRSTGRKK